MRIQNTPFGSNPFKRSVAIITVVLFLLTQLFSYAPSAFAQPSRNIQVQGGDSSGLNRLDSDHETRIPPELGKIDESFHGTSGKTILYIQDAHDSLEAQENIAKIINHLVSNCGVKTVFEEGYEGPVPTDKYFGFIKDPKIKEKVSWFFMDHLRLGGAEYAHINRTKDFNLVGADSLKLHKENIKQYRLSAEKKDAVNRDLKVLEKELKSLADSRFPKELKEWLKTKEQYDAKKLDLFTYLGRTMPLIGEQGAEKGLGLIRFLIEAMKTNDPAVIEKAKHIDAREIFGELIKLDQAVAETHLNNVADKQLFEYYKTLSLLNRLNDLQVSQEEYEAVKASLKAFDTDSFAKFIFSQAPKTLILSKMWEQNIKEAIRFYEIAQERDHSISEVFGHYSAADKRQKEDPNMSVLVFGGFHKESIKRILEAHGISYLVVSPHISKSSPRHEQFYKRLMTDGKLSFELPANIRTAVRAECRIVGWNANSDLARAEFRTLIPIAEKISNRDDFSLAAEQAMKAFRSEMRARDDAIEDALTALENDPTRKDHFDIGTRRAQLLKALVELQGIEAEGLLLQELELENESPRVRPAILAAVAEGLLAMGAKDAPALAAFQTLALKSFPYWPEELERMHDAAIGGLKQLGSEAFTHWLNILENSHDGGVVAAAIEQCGVMGAAAKEPILGALARRNEFGPGSRFKENFAGASALGNFPGDVGVLERLLYFRESSDRYQPSTKADDFHEAAGASLLKVFDPSSKDHARIVLLEGWISSLTFFWDSFPTLKRDYPQIPRFLRSFKREMAAAKNQFLFKDRYTAFVYSIKKTWPGLSLEARLSSYATMAAILNVAHENFYSILSAIRDLGLPPSEFGSLIKALPLNNPFTRILLMLGQKPSLAGCYADVTQRVIESGHWAQLKRMVVELANAYGKGSPEHVAGALEVLRAEKDLEKWTEQKWDEFRENVEGYYRDVFEVLNSSLFREYLKRKGDREKVGELARDLHRELDGLYSGNFWGFSMDFKAKYSLSAADTIALFGRVMTIKNLTTREFAPEVERVQAAVEDRGVEKWQAEVDPVLRQPLFLRGQGVDVIYQGDMEKEKRAGFHTKLTGYAGNSTAEEVALAFQAYITQPNDASRARLKRAVAGFIFHGQKVDPAPFARTPVSDAETRAWLTDWQIFFMDTFNDGYRRLVELKEQAIAGLDEPAFALWIKANQLELIPLSGLAIWERQDPWRILGQKDSNRAAKVKEIAAWFSREFFQVRGGGLRDDQVFNTWKESVLSGFHAQQEGGHEASDLAEILEEGLFLSRVNFLRTLGEKSDQVRLAMIATKGKNEDIRRIFDEERLQITRELAGFKEEPRGSEEIFSVGFFDDLAALSGFMMSGVCVWFQRHLQVAVTSYHVAKLLIRNSAHRWVGLSEVMLLKTGIAEVSGQDVPPVRKSAQGWQVLCLPNLNMDAESNAMPRELGIQALLEFAQKAAESAGMQGAVVPVKPEIHSQTEADQKVIADYFAKGWLIPAKLSETILVSTSAPEYDHDGINFQDVYLIQIPPADFILTEEGTPAHLVPEARSEARAVAMKRTLSDPRGRDAVLPLTATKAIEKRMDSPGKGGQALNSFGRTVAPGIRKAVLVIEKAAIDRMSPEDYEKLLVLVATERSKIRLVVPGSERGGYNARVAELSDAVLVSYRLPEAARSGKVPVFGFANDSADALKGRLNDLGENGKGIAVRIDECFALENGIEGIILAILNIPPDDLARKRGLLYDSRGLFNSQVQAFVDTLVRRFTVISQAA